MEVAGSSVWRCPVSRSHCHPIRTSFVSPIKVSPWNRLTPFAPLCFSSASTSQLTPTLRSEMSLCVGTHFFPHPNKLGVLKFYVWTLDSSQNTDDVLNFCAALLHLVLERLNGEGEDAYFVSSYGSGVIAVADGVSGWAEQNVDPTLFSRELMANALSMVDDTEVNYDPQILLRKAHETTSSKGSATVVVAMMEGNGTLKIANVGDCGLRVIRKGQVAFTTCPQEHYFDCPYQLSSEATTQTYLDAVVSSVKLMEGDIIVMGSDGLFDNVYDREIVSTVASNSDVTEAAKALARLARDYSMDSGYDSPYSSEARSKGVDVPDWKKLLGMKLTGGKLDDITVIVGVVKHAENSLPNEVQINQFENCKALLELK